MPDSLNEWLTSLGAERTDTGYRLTLTAPLARWLLRRTAEQPSTQSVSQLKIARLVVPYEAGTLLSTEPILLRPDGIICNGHHRVGTIAQGAGNGLPVQIEIVE